MSNRNKFRNKWKTLTELGTLYGVSARKFGSMLKEHGLRNKDGSPSEIAEGFFHTVEPKNGHSYILWGKHQVTEYLARKGVEKTVSNEDASKRNKARNLVKSYLEAQRLDDEGCKTGHWLFCDLVPDIKKVGLELFNEVLTTVKADAEPLTLEDW